MLMVLRFIRGLVHDGLLLGIARVFLQRVVYYGEIGAVLSLLMDQDAFRARFDNVFDVSLLEAYTLAKKKDFLS